MRSSRFNDPGITLSDMIRTHLGIGSWGFCPCSPSWQRRRGPIIRKGRGEVEQAVLTGHHEPCNAVATARSRRRSGSGKTTNQSGTSPLRVDDNEPRCEHLARHGARFLAAAQQYGHHRKHCCHKTGTVPFRVHMKQQKGFTLVALLISIVVGMVSLLAVYAAASRDSGQL